MMFDNSWYGSTRFDKTFCETYYNMTQHKDNKNPSIEGFALQKLCSFKKCPFTSTQYEFF